MISDSQREAARRFRQQHLAPPLLVLPNAWDAASARVLEQAGFSAIGTTSSGVAAALGYPDGQHIGRELLIESLARITRVVSCPVTADIEAGYGESVEEVLQTVRAVIDAGAVGINIEDSRDQALVELPFQVELLKAIRQCADSLNFPLVINARADVYLVPGIEPAARFSEVVKRAQAYREAGADCLFLLNVGDATLIAELVQALSIPLSLAVGPSTPPVVELERLGVARVSLAGGLMRAALGHLQRVARELHDSGTYASLHDGSLSSAEFRGLFQK